MTHRHEDALLHFGGNEPLVEALVAASVRFLVIGGLAVSWHCPDRTADDLDLLIDPAPDNAEQLLRALAKVGVHPVSASPFTQAGKQLPLKFGSLYAELLTPHPGGITYAEADADAVACKLFGLSVRIASVPALIRMKQQAAGTTTGNEQKKHVDDLTRLTRVLG
jgi:hypothetical protein